MALQPQQTDALYLDYNGTTPIFSEVAAAIQPFLTTFFGNPSSLHVFGRTCKAAVEQARAHVAQLVNAQPSDIIFTSCGTESDNWAIWGAVAAARSRWGVAAGGACPRTPHVVASSVEHPAVIAYLTHLAEQGLLTYTEVPVTPEGLVRVEDVVASLTPDTVLVTLMHSNNEVGSLQPVAQVVEAVRAHERASGHPILIHCDAAQSLGKVVVDVEALGVDLLTIVGHKFGAPKGVAALYVRHGVSLPNLLHGGGQEGGRRAGTENVALVVGLGCAAQVVTEERDALTRHMATLRDSLQAQLLAALPPGAVRVNGPSDPALRLPNTLSISICGLSASAALSALADKLAASAGAACHSLPIISSPACASPHGASPAPAISSVLKAMGVPVQYAVGTLRLSVGRGTTQADIDQAAQLLLAECEKQGVQLIGR